MSQLIPSQTLIDENHAHLISLGVSHESLETIRHLTAAQPYGLSTKLTGAGGGGCAVTLVPDSMSRHVTSSSYWHLTFIFLDFRPELLQNLIAALEKVNFQTYLTSVGGSGVGILSPYDVHRNVAGDSADPITPPDTPSPDSHPGDFDLPQLKTKFDRVAHDELSQWADAQGRWLYV